MALTNYWCYSSQLSLEDRELNCGEFHLFCGMNKLISVVMSKCLKRHFLRHLQNHFLINFRGKKAP